MPRILADLPEDDIEWLDRLAEEQGKSRAAVLREAVSVYRGENSADWIESGFGLWRHRDDIGDAVAWQRRERASSTRPWDDDYEDVKAEFPDLFDAEDDRQREIYKRLAAKRDAHQ
ncbi:ribbon-helix-helix domain-containing protein [Leptolyngbya sp. 15MV]|nr:ribbon-helix-helix domain-containing protein [Leptolyngbya sp. 15MV]